jgi:hypothetical protein
MKQLRNQPAQLRPLPFPLASLQHKSPRYTYTAQRIPHRVWHMGHYYILCGVRLEEEIKLCPAGAELLAQLGAGQCACARTAHVRRTETPHRALMETCLQTLIHPDDEGLARALPHVHSMRGNVNLIRTPGRHSRHTEGGLNHSRLRPRHDQQTASLCPAPVLPWCCPGPAQCDPVGAPPAAAWQTRTCVYPAASPRDTSR